MRALTIIVISLHILSLVWCQDSRASHYDYYIRPVSHLSPKDYIRDQKVAGNAWTGYYALVSPKQRWPSKTIAWEYKDGNTLADYEKANVARAMEIISEDTCIEFVAKTTETDYLSFSTSDTGCYASLGYSGGVSTINLEQGGCAEDETTPIHEIMHALGFEHEQSRYDRDLYVEVQWENIEKSNWEQFDKVPRTYAFPQYEFDFVSLMMYTLDSFGVGGRPSMVLTSKVKNVTEQDVGRGKEMSWTDTERIFSAYGCYSGQQEGTGETRINGRNNRLNIF